MVQHWHFWNPRTRLTLPDYIPDVVAGASGPTRLTQRKIEALRLVALLEVRGYLTREDFKRSGLRSAPWLNRKSGWLVPGANGRFVRGERLPEFTFLHASVYSRILAETMKRFNCTEALQ